MEIKDENRKKSYHGDLSPIKKENLNKDDFVSKILTSIVPTPTSLRCEIIRFSDSESVVLLEIDESMIKPHQFENRYFMRTDGHTVNAPHHYIEALFKQVKYPTLWGIVKLDEISFSNKEKNSYRLKFRIVIANLSELINEEKVFFKFMTKYGKISTKDRPMIAEGKYILGGNYISNNNVREVLHFGEPISFLEEIEVDKKEIENNQNVVEVLVTFAGRKSPLLISVYEGEIIESKGKLDFRLRSKEENALYAEKTIEYYGNNFQHLDRFLE